MVKVKPTANQGRITVKTSNDTNIFSIKDNLSEYYAKQAENWAHSEGMVNGIDYSSKYYAEQSKASAQVANEAKTETQYFVQGFDNKVQVAKDDIEQVKTNSINTINNAYIFAVEDMQEKSEGVLTSIEVSKAEVIDSINSTKTTVLNDIELVVDTSISEYTEISNQIKQDNSEASKLAQDWATSEVLVDNIDYSAKYYAEKAKDNSGIFYDELTDEDLDVDILEQGYVSDLEFEEALATKQDKGDYALRSEIPSITHLATKNEVNAKQDKGDYATRTELSEGLDTKQDKGNYALKSDIPNVSNFATRDELPTQVSELENDSNYATQTQVLQAIASIPQFSLSIVDTLPETGEKMTLYLVPKEGTNNDVYDEYIWIEQTTSFEHLGTTAVDLTDYVKNTDYATTEKGGVIKAPTSSFGIALNNSKQPYLFEASNSDIASKTNHYRPITPYNLDSAVKTSVTTNTIELTDDEKTSARTWLGAVGSTDYATGSKAGVVKTSTERAIVVSKDGTLACQTRSLNDYLSYTQGNLFIGKGTLENVLTQYSKTVLTTEADYEALETKDANTLYLIEE